MTKSLTILLGIDDGSGLRSVQSYSYTGAYAQVGEYRGQYDAGFLFESTATGLPPGAEIISAQLQLKTVSISAPTFRGRIQGWSSVAADKQFSAGENSPSAVPVTTAYIDWVETVPQPTNGLGTKLFDVKSIIEELIALSGWTRSSDIAVVIRDNGSDPNCVARIATFEYETGEDKAYLTVEYNPPVILSTLQAIEHPQP